MDDEKSALMKQWTALQNDLKNMTHPNGDSRIPGALAPTNQEMLEPRAITLFLDLNGQFGRLL